MNKFFEFGEKVDGYKVNVLNENEVRAGAGILFLFAIISFLNSWLVGNFTYTKIFVIAFLIEFTIRILINPKYAPSLILGRFITRGQKPLYTGALQKRWAWSIGFILAIMMFYLIVLNDIKGPVNLFTCLLCLTLLFFEAAFGICLGCKLRKLFINDPLQECPSGNCSINPIEEIQKINLLQITAVIFFAVALIFISNKLIYKKEENQNKVEKAQEAKNCEPPQWAIDMGHAEKWKLHHGCK